MFVFRGDNLLYVCKMQRKIRTVTFLASMDYFVPSQKPGIPSNGAEKSSCIQGALPTVDVKILETSTWETRGQWTHGLLFPKQLVASFKSEATRVVVRPFGTLGREPYQKANRISPSCDKEITVLSGHSSRMLVIHSW